MERAAVFLPLSAIVRRLTTTNHKQLGINFLFLGLLTLVVEGTVQGMIRIGWFHTELQILGLGCCSKVVALQGPSMILGTMMPALVGLAYWQIPSLVNAPEMAFPQLTKWSFWLLTLAYSLLLCSIFLFTSPSGFAAITVSIQLMAISYVIVAMNVIATILHLRDLHIRLMEMPVVAWSWLIWSFLMVGTMPLLASTALTTSMGNDLEDDGHLLQHVFWFFGHPEMYLLILPSFGITFQVLSGFSPKSPLGNALSVSAMTTAAVLSFLVFIQKVSPPHLASEGTLFLVVITMLMAIPVSLMVLRAVLTLFHSTVRGGPAALFARSFMLVFSLGLFSGLLASVVAGNFPYRDSYFVVAHQRYALFIGPLCALFAGVYGGIPGLLSSRLDFFLGSCHFWISALFLNVTMLPMLVAGLAEMASGSSDMAPHIGRLNMVWNIGALGLGMAQLFFVLLVAKTARNGRLEGRARGIGGNRHLHAANA